MPQNHAVLQCVDILQCQVKGTDLSSLTARSSPEQGHFQSSTMIAVTNSAVKYARHLHRDFSKVLLEELLLYAIAPGEGSEETDHMTEAIARPHHFSWENGKVLILRLLC